MVQNDVATKSRARTPKVEGSVSSAATRNNWIASDETTCSQPFASFIVQNILRYNAENGK